MTTEAEWEAASAEGNKEQEIAREDWDRLYRGEGEMMIIHLSQPEEGGDLFFDTNDMAETYYNVAEKFIESYEENDDISGFQHGQLLSHVENVSHLNEASAVADLYASIQNMTEHAEQMHYSKEDIEEDPNKTTVSSMIRAVKFTDSVFTGKGRYHSFHIKDIDQAKRIVAGGEALTKNEEVVKAVEAQREKEERIKLKRQRRRQARSV